MEQDKNTTSAGAATARDDKGTQNDLSRGGTGAKETEIVAPGAFGPLRYWVNTQIRNGGDYTIHHADENCRVTELTMNGELRLEKKDGSFALVPLDARNIPDFFTQLV